MKFFLDENLPLSAVKAIQQAGYDVVHVISAGLRGSPDATIAEWARKEEAILVTKDLEFGNLMLYPPGSHFGLVVLRVPSSFKTEQINGLLRQFLHTADLRKLPRALTVLEVGRYRQRRL